MGNEGQKEQRIRIMRMRSRKTAELNQKRTPDLDWFQSPYHILKDLPPILLTNTHRSHFLVRKCTGRGDGPTRSSGRMGGGRETRVRDGAGWGS